MFYLVKMLKRKEKPLYPTAKAGGLYGLSGKKQNGATGRATSPEIDQLEEATPPVGGS